MPILPAAALSALLAAIIHIDWHLARPEQHRLSLGWSYHWLATAIVVGLVGWLIARRWSAFRWRLGATVFLVGVLLAQGVEPVIEVLMTHGQLGYSSSAERWAAFGRTLAAAAPVYWGVLWLAPAARPRLAST